jgi:predicted permease
MLRLFANILLPVLLAAGTGYWVSVRWKLDPAPLSRIAFNVLAPCLIFRVIVDSEMATPSMLRMTGLALAVLSSVAVLCGVAAWAVGCARERIAAVVLVVMLPNAGNFGLPTSLFAFGDAGLARASVFFITGSLLTFTAGVWVASVGRSRPSDAALGLFRVPAVWAIAAALLVRHFDLLAPPPIGRTIDLFADATIPVFLLILGMQLRGVGLRGPLGPIALAVAARLLLSPLVAHGLAPLFGVDELARQVSVLQAAMPSAVITIVLASEYGVEPRFVTAVVFTGTVLSPLTLTPLLMLLGAQS